MYSPDERILPGTGHLSSTEILVSDRKSIVFELVKNSLVDIEQRYGASGENPLAYHNEIHTLEVVEAASLLAQAAFTAGRIILADLEILPCDAGHHDWEHSLGKGLDEIRSADVAAERMRQTGFFTEEEISNSKKRIIGTTVYFIDGVMHQSADTNDYASMLLADADLASLGKHSAIYWDRAMRMLKETSGNPNPSNQDMAEFAHNQVKFLKSHRFYTEEAQILFPYKQENIRHTVQIARYYADL